MSRTIRVAHSPDSDDALAFYAHAANTYAPRPPAVIGRLQDTGVA
jgi:predicted solute-binding protein